MGIAAEIVNGVAEAVEGFLNEGEPVLFAEGVAESIPVIGITEMQDIAGKGQPASGKKLLKGREEDAAELFTEDPDGEEEMFTAANKLPVRRKAGAGNDAVDVGMEIQLLSPGVKDLDDTGNGAEIFPVGRKLQEGSGDTFVEEGIEELLVLIKDRIKLGRKSDNDMKIGSVNNFSLPLINPEFL